MGDKSRKTAIDIIGDVPWGTHFCQFYQTKEDLIDILVPYFEAGLENNELCMWITSEPLNSEDAKRVLKKKVKNLDDYIKKGQIEILDYTQWYTKTGRFDADDVLQGWIEKEKQALEKGLEGLRLTGNTFWLDQRDWKQFTDYEAAVNSLVGQHRMLAVCTYSLEKCTPLEIIDVVSNHEFALIRRAGKWDIIGSAEYKKTIEALRESEDKYRVIFEQAADSIVLIDAETGDLVEFNDRTHNNLGYTREEFQKLKISDFEVIESAQEVAKHLKNIVREGPDTFETKHRTKSGEIREILVSSKSISIGGRDFILSIWRDITERKNALEDLQISEANYRTIFDTANDAIFIHDAENGNILSVNRKACEMFGYAREELERLNVEDFSIGIPPYDQEHAVRWIKKAAKEGPQLFEWISKHKTGRNFWIEVNLKLVTIEGRDRMLAIVRDITKRKLATEKIENLARFPSENPSPVLRIAKNGVVLYANGASDSLLAEWSCKVGQTAPESLYRTVSDVFASSSARRIEIAHADSIFAFMIVPVVEADYVNLYGRDITERKKAQEVLRASEEQFRRAILDSPFPIMIHAEDGEVLQISKVWTDLTGYAPEEIPTLSAWTELAYGDRKDIVKSRIDKIFDYDTRVEEGEYVISSKDGETLIWDFSSAPLGKLPDGRRLVISMAMDITERKQIAARQELAGRVLERLNQKSARPDLIHDVIKLIKESTGFEAVGVRLHEGGDFPYFGAKGFPKDFVEDENYLCARNEEGKQILDEKGHPVLSCMCGSVIIGRADPDLPFFTEGGSFWTNSTTELQSSASLKTLQIPLRNRCNEAGYESVALVPLRRGDETVGLLQLNDSRPGRFTLEMIRFFEGIGASIGIALARIKAEENMHNLAKFPSENPSPVLRISKEGTVLYANSAGSELLKTWECNIGEQVPEHWYQYVLRILKSGSNEELEASCGERVFSLIIAPVVEAGYVNTYGIDITERKLAEEDLRKYRQHLEELVETRTGELTQANRQLRREIEARKGLEKEILNVSEQERRKIGEELHDSLGQQLTGIAFMTKVLEQKLAKKSLNEAADVAKIAKLVNQATNQARSLAKGLHPIDLDTETLMSTLQDLAESTETLFGIHCTFKCDKRIRVDNPEVAVHLYRITQEAITNAIKHGKAKNIQIDLAYNVNKSVLTVRSDGIDFPKEFEARHTGIGLQIMDHRVDIIEGSLDIRKAPKGGTIMTCTFPLKRQ